MNAVVRFYLNLSESIHEQTIIFNLGFRFESLNLNSNSCHWRLSMTWPKEDYHCIRTILQWIHKKSFKVYNGTTWLSIWLLTYLCLNLVQHKIEVTLWSRSSLWSSRLCQFFQVRWKIVVHNNAYISPQHKHIKGDRRHRKKVTSSNISGLFAI